VQLDVVTFGAETSTESATFSKEETDLSQVLNYARENYNPELLSAIILASDGMYNRGYDPQYIANSIAAPIYTIAVGDTIMKKDLAIKSMYHNAIAFLGDQFPIEVDIEAFNARGTQVKAVLYKRASGQSIRIAEQSINITDDVFFTTADFLVEADNPGITQYVVQLTTLDGEWSTINNRKSAYVEVIDARQKIAIIAAAPHPDIAAIKQALSTIKNYEVEVLYAKQDDVASGPRNIANTHDFFILHNIPSKKYPLKELIKTINVKKSPQWYITGTQTDLNALNDIQDVVAVSGIGPSVNNVLARNASSFNLFKMDNDFLGSLRKYPPVQSPFGQYQASPDAAVLLSQQIGSLETDYPLIAFNKGKSPRIGVMTATGLWRWRIHNYKESGEHTAFDDMIAQIMQYVGVKDDKRQFRLASSENVYNENQRILLDAQLFNDSYEMINDSEVTVKITDEDNKAFNYTMVADELGYRLDVGTLPVGNYSARATTSWNGERFTASTRFSIRPIELEKYRSQADHNVLRDMSRITGGSLFYPDQVDQLVSLLNNNDTVKPIAFQELKTRKMLDNPLWLALIIVLLAAEWIIRRYFGSY